MYNKSNIQVMFYKKMTVLSKPVKAKRRFGTSDLGSLFFYIIVQAINSILTNEGGYPMSSIQVKDLSQSIVKAKNAMPTGEETKISLIIPFFQRLTSDIFDPDEFLSRLISDALTQKEINSNHSSVTDNGITIKMEVNAIINDLEGIWYSGICVVTW